VSANVFFFVTDLQGKPEFLLELRVISRCMAVLDLYLMMPLRQFWLYQTLPLHADFL
jgi:hypothetical protein